MDNNSVYPKKVKHFFKPESRRSTSILVTYQCKIGLISKGLSWSLTLFWTLKF